MLTPESEGGFTMGRSGLDNTTKRHTRAPPFVFSRPSSDLYTRSKQKGGGGSHLRNWLSRELQDKSARRLSVTRAQPLEQHSAKRAPLFLLPGRRCVTHNRVAPRDRRRARGAQGQSYSVKGRRFYVDLEIDSIRFR